MMDRLRRALAAILASALAWVDPPPPEGAPDPLMERTRELVTWAQTAKHASGEYKRHQVLAQLMKDFPDARQRDLAYAIERVMQERA